MRNTRFSLSVLLCLLLLSACIPGPGTGISTAAPQPAPTQTDPFDALLDQAAAQAPFTLLVPDPSRLSFTLEPAGVEVLPREENQPFVVAQTYRSGENQVRITQSSLVTGQAPMKGVSEAFVRGGLGFWVELNVGEKVLYWEEEDSSLTLGGLAEQQLLDLSAALAPYDKDAPASGTSSPAHPDAARLVKALTRQGFELELSEVDPPTALLAPAPGVSYTLGEGWLHIHWYADEASASQKAAEVSADPAWALLDWVDRPHFYRCGSAIALYLGAEEAVQSALQAECGVPFAPTEIPPLASDAILQPTPTEISLPTARETPLLLPPGLTVEEYALQDRPQFEPLLFKPVQGSGADILLKHSAERGNYFLQKSFFEDMRFSMRTTLDAVSLVASENFNQDGSEGWVTLTRDGEEIYRVGIGPGSPITALRGLWTFDTHWALETAYIRLRQEGNLSYSDVAGQISQDGVLLNDLYGYEEMFGLQTMAGRPFYFFKQDGKIGFSYDGKTVETGYDEIPHYGCCSAAELNPRVAQNMVAFFAQKDGVWYYVEIGVYE